jgi:hypothetical protein
MKSVRKITFYTCIGLGLIVVIIGIFFIHGLIEPVTTTNITATASAAPALSPPIKVTGTYANFSYPSSLKQMQGMQGPEGNELAVYNFGKSDIEFWHLAISINQLNQPNLTADSGYLLRENEPSRYQATTIVNGKNTFTIMTDTQAGGFSKVAFSLDGDKSADISLIGDDPSGSAALSDAFRQVLQTWQWH